MAEISPQIEIPNRALFKASEVCDLAKVQPYVLRSWEAEFKDLGVTKSGSTTRVYRREDVERVLRIKHLLLIEGLTLAGVRRKLEEESEPPLEEAVLATPHVAHGAPVSTAAREQIEGVKRGLRALLDLLESPLAVASASAGEATLPVADFALTPAAESAAGNGQASRRASAKDEGKSASPRRKRSA